MDTNTFVLALIILVCGFGLVLIIMTLFYGE
jgi:hypothetical protein